MVERKNPKPGENWSRRHFLKATALALAGGAALGNIGCEKPYLPENPANKPIVENFWRSNLPPKEAQLMIEIARKESGFNQFEENGRDVYRGRKNSECVGIMQIHEGKKGWKKEIQELGLDVHTMEGNLQMALWIIKNRKRGARYWSTYGNAAKAVGFVSK